MRGALERRATGAVTDMTVSEAYEILRGNELVLSRYTAQQASDTGAGGVSANDLVKRFANDPAVLRRLIRENAQSIVNQADADTRRFLQATADLLRSFRGIDGRKTVVLFSEGFYADNVARDVEDVAAAAAETYAVVHAFELNRRADLTAAASSTADDAMETSSRLEPLGSLAAETGGMLVKDAATRLDAALAALLPDDGGYYLIGFEPAVPEAGDNAYRRIRLHVNRPGARVISRTGYAIGATPTPADRRRAIDTALGAPFTQQGLKLEYTTYVGQSAVSAQQRVAVSLVAQLPVRRAGGAATGDDAESADIVFVVRNSRTGQAAASGSDRLALPTSTEPGVSTGSSSWRVGFDLPAGEYIMRCVVREPGGIVGSADRRFQGPCPRRARCRGHGPDLVSPGETLPVRNRGYTEGTLVGTLRLHGPDAAKLQDVIAKLELTPAAGSPEPGATGRAGDAVLGEITASGRGVQRDVKFAVPLERLPAGPYVARAIVRVDGEVVADVRRPVDVIVGAPPSPLETGSAPRPRDALDGAAGRRLIREASSSPIRAHSPGCSQRRTAAVGGRPDGSRERDGR